MSSSNGFESVPIRRIALGIRFQQQLGLEDMLGAVVDDILSAPNFGPDRFDTTLYGPESKQLVNEKGKETISLTRADAIFETRSRDYTMDEIAGLAADFVDSVWVNVCKRAPRVPSVIRYGCFVSFGVPDDWNPIRAMLNGEPAETSEFDLRYVRRLATEGGLASRDVNDYRNATVSIQTRKNKTTAMIDFQHLFDPAVSNDRLRKDWPYVRFVEKAVAYYRVQGWEFIRNRLERLARAA